MTMDWLTTMEVFVRVVETGSFSGAARLLHVGQPATSKTIAQLERRLGVTLLLRSSRGLTAEAILDDRDVELIEEGIDVGFLMGMLADSTMVARKIGQSRRLVLGTPSYFKKAGEPSTPAELADHQAVIFDLCPNRGRSTWSFRSGTTEQTVTLKGNVRTTAAEGLREAVFAGLGLLRRFRMDVPARSRQRQGHAGIAGLDVAVDGFVGDIPDGPPRQRESACLHRLRRGSATPDQLRGATLPSGKHSAPQ
jgi:DNA-binding transcriptional LysR family regulator